MKRQVPANTVRVEKPEERKEMQRNGWPHSIIHLRVGKRTSSSARPFRYLVAARIGQALSW